MPLYLLSSPPGAPRASASTNGRLPLYRPSPRQASAAGGQPSMEPLAVPLTERDSPRQIFSPGSCHTTLPSTRWVWVGPHPRKLGDTLTARRVYIGVWG